MDRVAKLVRCPPDALSQLIASIHQDFDLEVNAAGGFFEAVEAMTRDRHGVDRDVLESALEFLLHNARPDQLRSMLKRHGAEFFFDAKTSKAIFQAWLKGLEAQ